MLDFTHVHKSAPRVRLFIQWLCDLRAGFITVECKASYYPVRMKRAGKQGKVSGLDRCSLSENTSHALPFIQQIFMNIYYALGFVLGAEDLAINKGILHSG